MDDSICLCFSILVAALLSGLVATWFLSGIASANRSAKPSLGFSRSSLETGTSCCQSPHDATAAAAFASAVNQIAVVFHDCDPVLSALRSFHEAIVESSASADLKTKRLLELCKSMDRFSLTKISPTRSPRCRPGAAADQGGPPCQPLFIHGPRG